MSGGARGWPQRLLAAAGLPVTPQNVTFLAEWAQAEGGSARYNPLNTTQDAAGATNYNSVGVKNYPDEATGLAATAKTLRNGRYDAVIAAMQKSDAPAAARAVVASPWGTGKQLLAIVGDSGGNAIPQGPTGGIATGIGDAAVASVKTVGDLVAALADRGTWVRVLEVVAGLGLVVGGVVLLQKGTVTAALGAVKSATPGAVAGAVVTKAPAAVAGAL